MQWLNCSISGDSTVLKLPEDSPVSWLTVRKPRNYEEDREVAGDGCPGFKTRGIGHGNERVIKKLFQG